MSRVYLIFGSCDPYRNLTQIEWKSLAKVDDKPCAYRFCGFFQ